MKKVFIKFDPYNMKSTVLVDGKEIQNNKHCDNNLKNYLNANVPMPIQSWIDPISRDNWKGLLYTLCQMGDKDIMIEFAGREIDYQDIKNSLYAQNETIKCGANLTFCELNEEIPSDKDMNGNISKVISLMLTDQFSEIVAQSNSSILIEKYKHLKETYEEINNEEFRIVFTGTYSSGKSSTINALIGKNILPTASGTCTSKVCRIINDDSKEYFAKLVYTYNGKTYELKCNNEKEIQDGIKTSETSVDKIDVYTDLGHLYPSNLEKNFRIVIVDTPGTDSATGNDTHKTEDEEKRLSKKSHIEITKDVLISKQKEMVVLVSDDKLEDDNIVELLDLIETSANEDDGAFNDRFLFVMNMCDSLQYSNEGETLENYVKNYISNIKKIPNSRRIRNIVNPRVFPISSGTALAVINGYTSKPNREERQTQKAELFGYYNGFCNKVYYEDSKKLEEMIKDFNENYLADLNYCLEQQSSISEYTKYKYKKSLNGKISIPERILIHSGVPALKNAIQKYIMHYAYPIKVRQLLNCFADILIAINAENNKEIEELKKSKENYDMVKSAKQITLDKKEEEEKKEKILKDVSSKMTIIMDDVNGISDKLTQINSIRSEFYTMKNNIATQINGRTEIPKEEGNQILEYINNEIDGLIQHLKDVVALVKEDKKKQTNSLYEEFMYYINELKEAGIFNDGDFKLEDTIEYKRIIDKEGFKAPEEISRVENNERKKHIEFGYGVGNFFSSIKRTWETRKEPDTIENHYIDINDYVNENILPLEKQIDKYIVEIQKRYKCDIDSLKTNVNCKIEQVFVLVCNNLKNINIIRKKAAELSKDETKYKEKIKKLGYNKAFIESLINTIKYTQL